MKIVLPEKQDNLKLNNINSTSNYNQTKLKPINLLGLLVLFIGFCLSIVAFRFGYVTRVFGGPIVFLWGIYLWFRISRLFHNDITSDLEKKKNTLKKIVRNTGIFFIILGSFISIITYPVKPFADFILSVFVFIIGIIIIIFRNHYFKITQKLTPYKFVLYSLTIGLVGLILSPLLLMLPSPLLLAYPIILLVHGTAIELARKQNKLIPLKLTTTIAIIINLIPIVLSSVGLTLVILGVTLWALRIIH